MQSCMMKTGPPWADLPPELLGLVLKRLPSLADRVRFRAVCHPWRSNARLQFLPPPLPWLTLLDGTNLSIPDGEVIWMPVPDDCRCSGSIDSWLFFMESDDSCLLMNPFSKARVDLPKLATVWCHDWFNAYRECNPHFYKVVVPSPLYSSSDSLVATLILDEYDGTVCVCQPPANDVHRVTGVHRGKSLKDIVFFNGKLYGVTNHGKLLKYEISCGLGRMPKILSMRRIIDMCDSFDLPKPLHKKARMCRNYLVECSGKLLMVTRLIGLSFHRLTTGDDTEHDRTEAFKVFKADLSTNPGRWRCAYNLGGHALFLGWHCSKSFPAEECIGVQEDCIYFMCDYAMPEWGTNPLRDSGVYNMRNGNIMPLLSETAAMVQHCGGQWQPTWIFPSDSMESIQLDLFRVLELIGCSVCNYKNIA